MKLPRPNPPKLTLIELLIPKTIATIQPPRAHALWNPDSNPDTIVSSCDKATWIKSRRPSNPDLYCCNYNQVEAAIREGAGGKDTEKIEECINREPFSYIYGDLERFYLFCFVRLLTIARAHPLLIRLDLV